jgi:hypothetical protein
MTRSPRAAFAVDPFVVGESVLVIKPGSLGLARAMAALLSTRPLGTFLLARAKRRGIGTDVSVALARTLPWPRGLEEGARVSPDVALVGAIARETLDDRAVVRAVWRSFSHAEPRAFVVDPSLGGRAVGLTEALVARAVATGPPRDVPWHELPAGATRQLGVAADAAASLAYGLRAESPGEGA